MNKEKNSSMPIRDKLFVSVSKKVKLVSSAFLMETPDNFQRSFSKSDRVSM